ncbi:hypothetical protein ACFV4K_33820 [Nocardia sp. NPDC059764]|uniref:hypothetical protein n=1 Tax=Nocardia sp. NPDC059764 TaxID=3346939 RepID=UPI00364C0B08
MTAACCGDPSVTVRAPHFAFGDLVPERPQRAGTADHAAHASPFRTTHMVELQHNRVILAAVDTRIFQQVLVDSNSLAMTVETLTLWPQYHFRSLNA